MDSKDDRAKDDPLVPVPIPPLLTLLMALEKQKGSPLTEQDVLTARDNAVCIMLRASAAQAMAQARGFPDLDPRNVWEEWRAFLSRA